MTKPEILQMGAYAAWDQEPLDAAYTVHRLFEAEDKGAFLSRIGPRVEAIATRGDLGADRAVIEACPNLKIVSVYGVGFDAVDLDACRERGVRVTNTPGVLDGDVADLALGMMLAFARGMVGAEAWVRSGSWAAKGSYPLQTRMWGRRAGILGLGRIGTEIARRCAAFGMEIAYSATAPKDMPADWTFVAGAADLARRSDFLIVALAASAATRHIVDAAVLEALGPDGILVNISRASNVDEGALLDALEARAIKGAALDVFEGEPAVDPRFLALDNVLLQPHQGSGTEATRKAMGALVRENLAAHFAGRPLPTPVV